MRDQTRGRRWQRLAAIAFAITATAVLASTTQAEDAPADKRADKPAASAETPPWSAPTAPPSGKSGSDELPPPMVVPRRGSRPGDAVATVPRIKDIPSRPLPRDARPATSGAGAEATPAATPRAGLQPIPPNPNKVISVGKTHNIQGGPEGGLLLQLDIRYEVQGQAGRDVFVGIWFARKDDGTYIKSTMPEYADPSGRVTVQTRAARIAAAAGRYEAALRVPYQAFPAAPDGSSYEVEARVQILRNAGRGMVNVLALGETTFRVYGAAKSEAAPGETKPADDGFPAPAAPLDLEEAAPLDTDPPPPAAKPDPEPPTESTDG